MSIPTRGHLIRRCVGCGEPWLEPALIDVRLRAMCPHCNPRRSHGMTLELEQLYAEHVAAAAELRRLRARNTELEKGLQSAQKRLAQVGDWRHV